ncbi:MAG: putative enoyl-CoA hydratase [Frankiales bacterium]|nr:putative enoyl-CoA hydratase [Frankiales bacterium]
MTGYADLDPRTPVLVGVGQASERLDSPDYRARSAVDLAADAAREALVDTGADPADVAAALDVVAAVRQFEISTPMAAVPLGRSDNVPRSVARRLGADPRRAVLEVGGGQSPQHLLNEFAAEIAAGRADAVLVCSGEAISTARHLRDAPDRPDFTEHVEGDLEDRGLGLRGLMTHAAVEHGLVDAPSSYALLENARRTRLGLSAADHAAQMGELFAPFTRVAAKNPHAAAPVERDAVELVTPTTANRVVAEPYTRYLVARDQVNQGAAALLVSVEVARRLGVPEDRWVFLVGHADVRERTVLERADLGAYPAACLAVEHALEVAGVGLDQVDVLDLYSCFPIAVTAVLDGLGFAADDPRGLTVTGGLPFFGGAGNGYSLHAVAEVVGHVRSAPRSTGLVGANGGVLSKYSVGVYSTVPTPWRADDSARLQREVDAWPAPGTARRADGWARLEGWTVQHGRDGRRSAVVVGRLEEDGRRFYATGVPGDDDLLGLLAGEPGGARLHVRSTGQGNRVTTSEQRTHELVPRRVPGFRQEYEHVRVHRDGHVLEVTIDRPDSRNALTPPANEELDEVFDAYFADPDLWVAILTGAGERAFSAGNDLLWTASGKPTWVPQNGFAGLTSRRDRPKPVIAAVNGYALGGGFEIALACHLVVADETAVFGLPEARTGLIAAAGGLVRLPRALPEKLASELVLTGRRLPAAEAFTHGLVNRVVPAGTALEGARALAEEVLRSSPTSVRLSLAVMQEAAGTPDVVDAVEAGGPAIDELLVSEDMVVGLMAFATKTSPHWTGR